MPYLVDGSNVLGRRGADRESDEAKRHLVKLLAGLARMKRTSVVCVFDGHAPEGFARHLGRVTVLFSGNRSADDLIVERAAEGKGWKVVTADRQLAARTAGRRVEIVEPRHLLAEVEAAAHPAGEVGAGEDWEAWFSDPKNRNV
jgi:predicted RNA-binding protein with PIN domain